MCKVGHCPTATYTVGTMIHKWGTIHIQFVHTAPKQVVGER